MTAFLVGVSVGVAAANALWIWGTTEPTSISQWNQFRDALRRACRKDQP